jgi:hypothetical protein
MVTLNQPRPLSCSNLLVGRVCLYQWPEGSAIELDKCDHLRLQTEQGIVDDIAGAVSLVFSKNGKKLLFLDNRVLVMRECR